MDSNKALIKAKYNFGDFYLLTHQDLFPCIWNKCTKRIYKENLAKIFCGI